ncbi:F420H(2):quinone oxidoreductase, partial [Bacteroides fragilis]
NQGGAVIGACYDKNWRVKHEVAYTLDDVQKMRGSKYVQSRIKEVL